MTVATLTPREQPGLALAVRSPVTTLYVVGREHPPYALDLGQRRFMVGAASGDVVIPPELSTAVSPFHATMDRVGGERGGAGLLVQDLGSTNGTYPGRPAARCDAFHVHAGDTFWIADVALFASDMYLDALRTHVACHVGLGRREAIEDAMAIVAGGGPLLLIGEAGTGARRLAGVIHATSPHRDCAFLAADPPPLLVLRHAHGATVYVDLDRVRTLPARVAAALFDPAYGLRLIFAASDERKARAHLDHSRARVRAVALAPLAARPADVPALLGFHWATELESGRRVEELGPKAVRALAAHRWPRNLDELHEASPRILAYLTHGSLRRAAAALGVKHQTLGGYLGRIGFPALDREDRDWPASSRRAHEARP